MYTILNKISPKLLNLTRNSENVFITENAKRFEIERDKKKFNLEQSNEFKADSSK